MNRLDRKAKLKEGYTRADEMAPKSGGKEGKMEEKRATNAENRQFREKDVTAGLEADEGVLMGENEGFKAAWEDSQSMRHESWWCCRIRARDAAQARRTDKKASMQADRRAADGERLSERKQKESQTMDMWAVAA